MAGDQVQWRGGTEAEHASFTGALKEVTVDITRNTLRVHDGVTPGGHRLARVADLVNAAEDTRGLVELATTAEAQAGTDTSRAVTPAGARAAFAQYGLGTGQGLSGGADLNNLDTPGFYYANAPVNAPLVDSGHVLVNGLSAGGPLVQQYTPNDVTRVFVRCRAPDGVWSAWKEIASTDRATPSLRNLLINSTFGVNQRGYVSGTAATSAAQYTYDRWRVVVSGQSVTLSGETLTAPAGGVEQVVEGGNIETGTYVLNWTGTATATINGSAVAKGGTVNLTTGTNATVRFSGGTVTKPQLEPGAVATAFDRRPMPVELALCLYYGRRVTHDLVFAAGTRATYNINGYIAVDFPSAMRTTPTIYLGAVSNAGTPYILSASPTGFVVGAAAANANLATMAGFFADAEIQ